MGRWRFPFPRPSKINSAACGRAQRASASPIEGSGQARPGGSTTCSTSWAMPRTSSSRATMTASRSDVVAEESALQHFTVAAVQRAFDADLVEVVPRSIETDLRWMPPSPAPEPGSLDEVRAFLAWLYAECAGLVETRAFPSKDRRFWRFDQWRALGRYLDIARTTEDVFFGVSTRW